MHAKAFSCAEKGQKLFGIYIHTRLKKLYYDCTTYLYKMVQNFGFMVPAEYEQHIKYNNLRKKAQEHHEHLLNKTKKSHIYPC